MSIRSFHGAQLLYVLHDSIIGLLWPNAQGDSGSSADEPIENSVLSHRIHSTCLFACLRLLFDRDIDRSSYHPIIIIAPPSSDFAVFNCNRRKLSVRVSRHISRPTTGPIKQKLNNFVIGKLIRFVFCRRTHDRYKLLFCLADLNLHQIRIILLRLCSGRTDLHTRPRWGTSTSR